MLPHALLVLVGAALQEFGDGIMSAIGTSGDEYLGVPFKVKDEGHHLGHDAPFKCATDSPTSYRVTSGPGRGKGEGGYTQIAMSAGAGGGQAMS